MASRSIALPVGGAAPPQLAVPFAPHDTTPSAATATLSSLRGEARDPTYARDASRRREKRDVRGTFGSGPRRLIKPRFPTPRRPTSSIRRCVIPTRASRTDAPASASARAIGTGSGDGLDQGHRAAASPVARTPSRRRPTVRAPSDVWRWNGADPRRRRRSRRRRRFRGRRGERGDHAGAEMTRGASAPTPHWRRRSAEGPEFAAGGSTKCGGVRDTDRSGRGRGGRRRG